MERKLQFSQAVECSARRAAIRIARFSRRRKVLNRRFPGVVNALASLKDDFVLDGELVVLDPQGRPSFQLLQGAASVTCPTYFYAFDVLHENGELLVDRPFSRRRAVLESLLAGAPEPLRVSPLLQAPAGDILEAVRQLGLEGVVGKRLDSRYEPGERSGAWIKLRVNLEQEFVIGGYIPGLRGFDALLVGVYPGARLRRQGEERIRATGPRRDLPGPQVTAEIQPDNLDGWIALACSR